MEANCVSYAYPNEGEVLWSLMIVIYPYLTGLVGGAFFVASLYYVFDFKVLRPVARFSLVASFSFLLVATMPLLAHLGQPQRALSVMITPNFRSAMTAFGYIYSSFLLFLLLAIWLIHRGDILRHAREAKGLTRMIFRALTLGVYTENDATRAFDRRLIILFLGIGFPLSAILPGYSGFLFGSLKANPWWSSPLVPVIFVLSEVTSGIAIVLVMYLITSRFRKKKVDVDCVHSLGRWLLFFAIITVSIEMLEIICLAYEGNTEWLIIKPLLFEKIAWSFWGLQVLFGAGGGILCLLGVVHLRGKLSGFAHNTLALMGASCLLIQVAAMRWNTIIGGQLFSKSMRGFLPNYEPHLLGREGILAGLAIFILPFIILYILSRYLSLFPEKESLDLVAAKEMPS